MLRIVIVIPNKYPLLADLRSYNSRRMSKRSGLTHRRQLKTQLVSRERETLS